MGTLRCIHNDSHIEQAKGKAGAENRKCSICGGSMKLMSKSEKLAAKEEVPPQGYASPKNREREVKPRRAFKKRGPSR
jgi:hypothetical protein